MKTNIVLIGFMATGKTTVAKAVARRLGKKYVSTDDMVVKKSKKTITQIFEEEGEGAFRKMEMEAIVEAAKMKNAVIDCGGGAVLNRINIERLKQDGVIISLKASPDIIVERNSRDGRRRPLLEVKNPPKTIRELLAHRAPLYTSSADYEIDTTDLTVEQVVTKIVEILQDVGE
ncbi:MAG: shikimate kinase [Nitrososphaeria archaeon]